MSQEPVVSIRTYSLVLLVLVLLTVLTVGISFIPLSPDWHMALGISIAIVKATLVALFFMHLLHSQRLMWVIVIASLVWLYILISLTTADYLSRGVIPHMPGH